MCHFTFKNLALLMVSFSFLACSYSKKDREAIRAYYSLNKSVYSDHRSEADKLRDTYRNPVETLRFFDVRPDMTVLEVSPGKGWYTQILGPYLDEGQLILALPRDNSDRSYHVANNKALRKMIQDNPDHYKNVSYSVFEPPVVMGPVAKPNSVDRILTFRNLHNWVGTGKGKEAMAELFKALKPGGILGVVDHRASTDKAQDPKVKSGYIREDYVIELAEAAGFEFLAKTEINANYLDTKNYANGVWTLPPSLRLQNKDRAKYLAIGESDRMTLKFRKPTGTQK